MPMPTGFDQLRAVAVARLFLDNVPRVRATTHALGEALAQVAQWYGADDAGFVFDALPSSSNPENSSPEMSPAESMENATSRFADWIREAARDPIEVS